MPTRRLQMDSSAAADILHRCGIPFPRPDFFTLHSSTVETLLAEADALHYRKPRNANGSRGRYWYDRLCRVERREAA